MTKKNRNVVDTCGLLCPQPVLLTKQALSRCAVGEEFEVLVDNKAAECNITRYVENNAVLVKTVDQGDGTVILHVRKS